MNAPPIPVAENTADLDSGATENEFPNGDDLAISRATDFYGLDELLTDQEREMRDRVLAEGVIAAEDRRGALTVARASGSDVRGRQRRTRRFPSSQQRSAGCGNTTRHGLLFAESNYCSTA